MAGKKQYSASDRWPRHTNKRVDELFQLARAYGWSLTEQTNHSTYRLTCQGEECEFVIFSTGKGVESVAKSKTRTVQRCSHNGEIQNGVIKANGLMDQAGTLLEAAETLVLQQQATLSLFSGGDEASTEEIEELLSAAVQLEEEAGRALPKEYKGADMKDIVDTASDSLAEAHDHLQPFHEENPGVKKARNRLKNLKGRAHSVRAGLESGNFSSSGIENFPIK